MTTQTENPADLAGPETGQAAAPRTQKLVAAGSVRLGCMPADPGGPRIAEFRVILEGDRNRGGTEVYDLNTAYALLYDGSATPGGQHRQ